MSASICSALFLNKTRAKNSAAPPICRVCGLPPWEGLLFLSVLHYILCSVFCTLGRSVAAVSHPAIDRSLHSSVQSTLVDDTSVPAPKLSRHRCCRGHRQPPPSFAVPPLIASACVFRSLARSLSVFFFFLLGIRIFLPSCFSSSPSLSVSLSSLLFSLAADRIVIVLHPHSPVPPYFQAQGISRVTLFTLLDPPSPRSLYSDYTRQ